MAGLSGLGGSDTGAEAVNRYDIAADIIKRFEGCKLTAYKCPAGVWTIGYGHTSGVKEGMVISEGEAFARLMMDMQEAGGSIEKLVKVTLNDNQFAALVSFVFNVGAGAFRKSTMLTLLNGNAYRGAAEQFGRWTKAGNQVLPGLVKRRAAERALFERKP